jgi:GDP-L-fucose synthase
MTTLVTGASGFLGKRVCAKLADRGLDFVRTSRSLGTDLRDFEQVFSLFDDVRPRVVLNCASFSGGIQFGLKYPADIFCDNMRMIANLFDAAHQVGVKRIVNPIPNCVYPRAKTLFKEAEIWDGALDETVLVYALLRKISWVGAWSYAKQHGHETINLVFSNMYGPGDHFEEERSHALGALVMKFVKARDENRPHVIIWGTGKPVREWLYVDDAAEAMIRGMYCSTTTDFVNVGVAEGISVHDLALKIKEKVGYTGELVFDTTKPDGAPYKTIDGFRGRQLLDWSPATNLNDGLDKTIRWYYKEEQSAHGRD